MDSASDPVQRPQPHQPEAACSPVSTYEVVCWDDPVNYNDLLTHVFMQVFNWSQSVAERHLSELLAKGKSVLVTAPPETAEFYVHQLRYYQLHATMEPAA
jgi:ATP-dependent Clp protease adapter protein ClpS